MNSDKNSQSLAVMMENARIKMTNAINQIISETSLPAYLIEGILLGIISEIRNQKNTEIIQELLIIQEQLKNQITQFECSEQKKKKEGAE